MIEYGIVKNGEKIIGYRTPKSELFIEQQRRYVEILRSKKEMLKLADYALETWARWRLTSIGYGNSPLVSQDIPKMPACSQPPIGCHDAPKIALAVVRAFEQMKQGNKTNRRYAWILNQLYMERKEGEAIVMTSKRLGVSLYQIRRAKEALMKLI